MAAPGPPPGHGAPYGLYTPSQNAVNAPFSQNVQGQGLPGQFPPKPGPGVPQPPMTGGGGYAVRSQGVPAASQPPSAGGPGMMNHAGVPAPTRLPYTGSRSLPQQPGPPQFNAAPYQGAGEYPRPPLPNQTATPPPQSVGASGGLAPPPPGMQRNLSTPNIPASGSNVGAHSMVNGVSSRPTPTPPPQQVGPGQAQRPPFSQANGPPMAGGPTPPMVGGSTPPMVGGPTPPMAGGPTPPMVGGPTPRMAGGPTPPMALRPGLPSAWSPGQPQQPLRPGMPPVGNQQPPPTFPGGLPRGTVPRVQPPPTRPPTSAAGGPYPGGPPTGPVAPPTSAPGQNSNSTSEARPSELPLPYHGQGQYSHPGPGGRAPTTPAGLTPNSEPTSRKSSRAPSPVPGQKYDALEGQFVSSPQSPSMPPMPGQNRPMQGQRPPVSGQAPFVPGQRPPMPGQGPSMPGQGPPMPGQGPPMPGQRPPMPGQGPSMPGQGPFVPGQVPAMPGPGPAMPSQGYAPASAGQTPPPPTSLGSGITGKRHYPPMAGTQPGPAAGAYAGQAPGVAPYPGQAPGSAPYPSQAPGSAPYPGAGPYAAQAPGAGPYPGPGPAAGQQTGFPNSVPGGGGQGPAPAYLPNNNPQALNSSFNNLKLQNDSLRMVNLLQERCLIPPDGLEIPTANLPQEYKKVNCSPEVMRCTLLNLPSTQSLLNKSRLPLGILIHPFKDLAQLPVIQSSVIVRCRSCRTYINPFVTFVDMRRWKCNLCFRANELPEEFNYDPVSRSYGEPQRRPEIKSSTIEFIAPSEYMLRPPQPAVYLFLLDVSFNAMDTEYMRVFCDTLLSELDRLPGDSRTQVGFIAYDRSLYFFNLAEGLSQPQLLVVSDVDEVFLPSPDNLLVNLQESKELIIELLNKLPTMFEKNMETSSALGAALQAAFKLMNATGGRVTVVQTLLPTAGPGALKNREDPNERAGKKIQHLGPATDFYKKMALDCSGQQIAVDLFLLNSQYADIASLAGISKYSGGSMHYFPGFHAKSNPGEVDRFEDTLRRYFSRKIGFEAVMRIRCTRGLSLHTFHGNFFVRSTDLLSLPNINPDSGFGMQMSIEDTLEASHVCFQAALLYTSSKGERRIRVHTLALPVTTQLSEIHAGADQQAIIGLLCKMGVDKAINSMGDARDAMINAAVDMLGAYGSTLTNSQRLGQVACPASLRAMPLYLLALLKSKGFRVGSSTKLDDRVVALEEYKTTPLCYLLLTIYPNLYPVHALDDKSALSKGDMVVPQPPLIQLSAGNMDRHGAYLMDTGHYMYLWIGGAISDNYCRDVLDVPNFAAIPDGQRELPEIEGSQQAELLKNFICHLNDQRPFGASLLIIREDSPSRHAFLQHMVEDRSESTFSYYEFIQHLQKEVKS